MRAGRWGDATINCGVDGGGVPGVLAGAVVGASTLGLGGGGIIGAGPVILTLGAGAGDGMTVGLTLGTAGGASAGAGDGMPVGLTLGAAGAANRHLWATGELTGFSAVVGSSFARR